MLHITTILIILLQSILPLLPSQIIRPLIKQQTESGVNSVLGDISYLVRFGQLPTPSINENLRISTHLTLVESLLRQRDISALTTELQQARIRHLDQLHKYRLRGVFPQNSKYPGQRRPCFIDDAGRICAVGYLIAASGDVKFAQEINTQYQYAKISQMTMPALDQWLVKSGLTALEAAMIQPSYYEPAHPCLVDINNHDLASLKKRLVNRDCNVNDHLNTARSIHIGSHSDSDNGYHTTTPLIYATRYGNTAIVKLLLSKGAQVDMSSNEETALMVAAQTGNIEIARLLINAGAKIDQSNDRVISALAREIEDREMIKLLLKAGVDRNYRNPQGDNITNLSLLGQHYDLTRWLHQNVTPIDTSVLMRQLMNTYVDKPQLVKLISQLDSPKLPQSFYDEATSYLATNNWLEVNKPLLEAGANINLKVRDKSLLMLAAEKGSLDMAKFLIAKQADINFQSQNGDTAYSLAIKHKHPEIAEMLLSAGAVTHTGSQQINQLTTKPETLLERIGITSDSIVTSVDFWISMLLLSVLTFLGYLLKKIKQEHEV